MLNICLCDDNHSALRRYAQLIENIARRNAIAVTISSFSSGEALLFHLAESPHADIIYLDVLMDRLNGMQTARTLRDRGCMAEIVFLTSSRDYVYDAFDVNATHYLLKQELTEKRFEDVFLQAAERAQQKETDLFVCEFGGVQQVIPTRNISYFEIWRRVITVHYGKESAEFYGTMEQLENRFKKDFVRVHRSYLVHMPYITRFQAQELELKTGERIPVGVTYLKAVKKAFSDYIAHSHIHGKE